MNYRIISKDLLLKLTNKEAYTFCCILLNSDRQTYISHIKEKTLSKITGYSDRTIKSYIKKFREIGLLSVETKRIKGDEGFFFRNTYYIHKPVTNYFRVEYDFLLEDLPPCIKGYILLLKCICYGGNNTTLYSLNEIGKKGLLEIGLSTIKKLNSEAISLKAITKEELGYTITTSNIYADTKKEVIPIDSDYLDYYKQIVDYCEGINVKPPKYDRELMEVIFYNCPSPSAFINLLSNRPFTEINIRSLTYFIKILRFKPLKRQKKEKISIII